VTGSEPPGPTSPPPGAPASSVLEDRRARPGQVVGFALLFLAAATVLTVFSARAWIATAPGVGLLKVTLKHVSAPTAAGPGLSREELERLPRHMRPQGGQLAAPGTRRETHLRIALDGRLLVDGTYRPGGLRHDGPTFVYEEIPLVPGRRRLEAALAEVGAPSPPPTGWRLEADVDVRPGEVLLLELSQSGSLELRAGLSGPGG